MNLHLPPHRTLVELSFSERPLLIGLPKSRVEILNDPSGRILSCFDAYRDGAEPAAAGKVLGSNLGEVLQALQRLHSVQVECRPPSDVIKRVDRAGTFFLGDCLPTTIPDRDEAHEMIRLLSNAKGRALIRCDLAEWALCAEVGFTLVEAQGDIATWRRGYER